MPDQRQLTPLELNHLQRFGISLETALNTTSPVEYLTGHADFLGLDFLVNPSTLIPRLESEKIISLALDYLHKTKLSHPTIADIGTGSGCLGISLAKALIKEQLPYTIYLSDISPSALKVARLNADRLLSSPVNIFFEESNLFQNYPKIKFDLILANLPYIPYTNISNLPESVKNFEPRLALDGGEKGVIYINQLLAQLPHFLVSSGLAIFEIDDTQSISDFDVPPHFSATIEDDIFSKPRFLMVKHK